MKVISKNNRGYLFALTLTLSLLFITGLNSLSAAGLLIADGGFGGELEIQSQDIDVVINNGIAVTTVTQEFKNLENRQVEALYTFPVPKEASVSNFSMWINGKEMIGEVVEKQRARQIYNSYKRKKRDPGLLEQKNYKTFEMRIFPIAANAIQKVQITYYQELEVNNDWCTYTYPLKTQTQHTSPQKTSSRFSFNLQVKSEIPITNMESPSHLNDFVIVSHNKNYYQASLEEKHGNLNKDIVVAYILQRPITGVDFIFSKNNNEDGFFLMTITAGPELKKLNTGMDFLFVLDISGSMANDGKMTLSRNSIEEFVKNLAPEDKFDMLVFNISTKSLFNKMEKLNKQNIKKSIEFLNNQSARGGTNLIPAISQAYQYSNPDRQLNIIVLSDGMTEQGSTQDLIKIINSRPSNTKVFCIGVGNEVNKPLLQEISKESGGISSFISKGDNFKRRATLFRKTLSFPAISNIDIDFNNKVYDVEPVKFPNLYYGNPVRIYGRYKGANKTKIKMSGEIAGRLFSKTITVKFPEHDDFNPEIERMWAFKRIQRLLNAGKREGDKNKYSSEIVRLGEAYSIVSEYTSFLVLENDNEYKRWKIKRRNALRITKDRNSQAKLRDELNKLKNKQVIPVNNANNDRIKILKQTRISQRNQKIQSTPNRSTRNNSSHDFSLPNFGGGGGAIDPFTAFCILIVAAFCLRQLYKKQTQNQLNK
jgi:Ca-activated chloride channel family protein